MSSQTDSFRPLASVVYLGIPGFTRKSVGEQAKIRTQMDDAVAAAASVLNEADRIILDAPDGAAIVVLGNAQGAMDAAERAIATTADAAIGVGINHGPVRLSGGEGDGSRLLGDGIDAAASIAGVANPGELLVSRSFRDALAEHAPQRATLFHHAKTFTDAQVRAHELFSKDVVASRTRSRRLVWLAALACVTILALGVGARFALESLVEARQPAFLVFDIRPSGEIYLDGEMKGKTPAITRLQVAAGRHTIEVRNSKYPPFITEVSLSPGEQMQVKHSFIAPAAQKRRGLLERLKFWQ